MVSNSHHERPSEVIVDLDRTMIGQKAPKDKQEQRQGYTPSNCRNPIKDTLVDWKPMKGIPHEFTNVAELGDTTNR